MQLHVALFHMHRHGAPNHIARPGQGQTRVGERLPDAGARDSIPQQIAGFVIHIPRILLLEGVRKFCARYIVACAGAVHFL